jgi:methionine--tRNA ligase beta chain
VTIDEFKNVSLRIGKVVSAERVEGSEKLLKLQVDLGELRQILSGIAKDYTPEALVGKSVVIVANLDPRKMMGMESQGMLLAAQGVGGKPVILTVEEEGVPPGAVIS